MIYYSTDAQQHKIDLFDINNYETKTIARDIIYESVLL